MKGPAGSHEFKSQGGQLYAGAFKRKQAGLNQEEGTEGLSFIWQI